MVFDVILLCVLMFVLRVSSTVSGVLFWLLAFPGVLLHELCHFFMALFTGGRPVELSLVPSKDKEGRWTLGYVKFHPTWYNGSLIALAPLFIYVIGVVIYLSFVQYMGLGDRVLWVYLLATFFAQAWPSQADWEIAGKYPAPVIILGGCVWWLFDSFVSMSDVVRFLMEVVK